MKKIISIAALPFLLVACGGGDTGSSYNYGTPMGEESLGGTNVAGVTDSYLMAAGPRYVIGSPYTIESTQYVPAEDMNYNQTGLAGIIPVDLHGAQTTNGEIFDVNQMVATSKTLPLPSIVRVTNLNNGQSAILRVNNRGPFLNDRIMDVSPAAARALSMAGQTRVQVQIMEEQSAQVRNATLGTGGSSTAQPVYDHSASSGGSGPFSVQAAAFYSEDNADALARRLSAYGNAHVVVENGMYKVRISDLDADGARNTIDALRRNENMAPGLLKDGRWINADSI